MQLLKYLQFLDFFVRPSPHLLSQVVVALVLLKSLYDFLLYLHLLHLLLLLNLIIQHL